MDFISFSIICVKVLLVFAITMLTILIMIYAERRVSAFMQGRLGPNRVGPQGILQPIADGIKFLMKEDIIPASVDKPIYLLAPAMLLIPALMTFAIIPFGSDITMFGRNIPLQVADINVGILYILALISATCKGMFLPNIVISEPNGMIAKVIKAGISSIAGASR
jgi:NADH-quinone oxidoreductase subunit H